MNSEGGKVWAEVINDGYREKEGGTTHARIGFGLSGLTERVTTYRGHIEAGPLFGEGHPGYRLRMELPSRSNGMVERKLER